MNPSILTRLFGPVYLDPSFWTRLCWLSVWTRLFEPVYLDPSILTDLFGPVYFYLSIWVRLFEPIILDLSIRPVYLDLSIKTLLVWSGLVWSGLVWWFLFLSVLVWSDLIQYELVWSETCLFLSGESLCTTTNQLIKQTTPWICSNPDFFSWTGRSGKICSLAICPSS